MTQSSETGRPLSHPQRPGPPAVLERTGEILHDVTDRVTIQDGSGRLV